MLLMLLRLKLTTPTGPAWKSQLGPEGLGIRSTLSRLPASVKAKPWTVPIAAGAAAK